MGLSRIFGPKQDKISNINYSNLFISNKFNSLFTHGLRKDAISYISCIYLWYNLERPKDR